MEPGEVGGGRRDGGGPGGRPKSAVGMALDGAEMVMRDELIRGEGTRLAALLPSFVFLVDAADR